MRLLKGLILSVTLVAGSAASAQPARTPAAAQPSFTQRVAAAAHPISLRNGQLQGPGAELLGREIGSSHFLMVGEQHATATIAEIIAALHREAASAGYHHSGVEIGRYSTRRVEQLIRSGQGRLAAFLRQPGNSFTVPFLFWREEVALSEQMVALSPRRDNALWGLDQEFVGSAPIVLAELERLATNPEQRRAVAALRARAASEPMLIGSMPPADFEPLRAAFPASRSREAAALVDDLMLSNRIYGAFSRREGTIHAANTLREEYMKRNFVRAFLAAERAQRAAPRVFLRFGANHAFRGFSMTDVPSLGNFIAEWGLSRGLRMTNIFIGCVGGQQNNPQSGQNGPCSSDDLPDDSPLRTQMSTEQLTLFDLRPLRGHLNRSVDAATRRMVLGFDFYLPVRNVQPATPLNARQ